MKTKSNHIWINLMSNKGIFKIPLFAILLIWGQIRENSLIWSSLIWSHHCTSSGKIVGLHFSSWKTALKVQEKQRGFVSGGCTWSLTTRRIILGATGLVKDLEYLCPSFSPSFFSLLNFFFNWRQEKHDQEMRVFDCFNGGSDLENGK